MKNGAPEPIFAPSAMGRIRVKKKEIQIRIHRGEITAAEGAKELRDFQSLTIAHVREHGPEGA